MQPNLEAEPHSENVVFIIQKPLFGCYFDHFKGGVRYIRFLKPIYQSRGGLRSRLHAPLFPPQVADETGLPQRDPSTHLVRAELEHL